MRYEGPRIIVSRIVISQKQWSTDAPSLCRHWSVNVMLRRLTLIFDPGAGAGQSVTPPGLHRAQPAHV